VAPPFFVSYAHFYSLLSQVFEEFATQEEVFQHAVAPVPAKLLKGYNCTVIAYGQTGSGKTHTIMGVNGGADGLLALSKRGEGENLENPEAEGMILKTTRMIFQTIQESPPSIEYTIRCSYVEIYLEKILDLLNPSGGGRLSIVDDVPGDEAAGVGDANIMAGVRIAGAAELCCFDEADVYGLLARGNACRTMSSTEMNTDSSRSHAVFVLKIEQNDKSTCKMTKSVLHIIDLAGSEMATSQSAAAQRSPTGASSVQTEAKMINKSLSALSNVIRAQLENQRGAEHSVIALSRHSKLTRFLRPSFGGNCMTTLLLTASPSSYNIRETMSTIRFGQRARRIHNPAVVNSDLSCDEYRKQLKESKQKEKEQVHLLKSLALECSGLKEEALEGTFEEHKHRGPLWKSIKELVVCDDHEEMDYKVSVRRRTTNGDNGKSGDELEKAQREIEKLRTELAIISKAKDDSENHLSDLQSEVAVLRSQNEYLIENKTKDMQELIDAKNDLQIMSQRKIEVEHNFRTSQFRENEAIVFLRQFRRFYRNVLRDKASHGSGSLQSTFKELSEKVPNAPDLTELVDVDALLLEAGLIEEHELREDKTAAVYIPSKTSLIRSRSAAQKAAKEAEVIEKGPLAEDETAETIAASKSEEASEPAKEAAGPKRPPLPTRGSAIRRSSYNLISVEPLDDTDESDEDASSNAADEKPGAGADAGAGSSPPTDQTDSGKPGSTPLWDQSGLTITKRQQLLGTPSGRLATMREEVVERELLEMANRCIELEQALKEERATVELLSGRAGGLNKKNLAQEAIQLRQQVEKQKENLTAIAWKMNELNLINKSYNEKMVNREQHVIYLEENYVELQNRNRAIIEERGEAERKLREELDNLQKVLGGMSVSLWQFSEEKPEEKRTFASRVVVPVHGGRRPTEIDTESRQRRLSDAESEPSLGSEGDAVLLGLQRDAKVETVDANTQTEDVPTQDDEMQTYNVETQELGIQTVDMVIDDTGALTTKASGDVLQIETVKSAVRIDEHRELEESSSAGKLAVVGAVGGALGAATAATVSRAANDDVTDDSNGAGATSAAVSRTWDDNTNAVSNSIETTATTAPAGDGLGKYLNAGSAAAVPQTAADEMSKDSSMDSMAKNLFSRTATVFSVLNRGHKEVKEREKVEPKKDADEMESYQGDGHASRDVEEEEEDKADGSLARDEWAAARDDFDFIVEDTAKSVGTARRLAPSGDNDVLNPEKSRNEFLDKALMIGHKSEDAIITMGSKRSILDEDEFGTVGEMNKSWEKSPKKPWEQSRSIAEEKKQSPKRDYGASNASFDAYDDYLSDDGSYDSVEKEGRNVDPRAQRKSLESASDDDFDKMMTATQAALVAAEEFDESNISSESVYSDPFIKPANRDVKCAAVGGLESEDAVDSLASMKSQENSMFVGGQTNDFAPRRFVEKASTKIKAGVMKEEKKHHDHHHKSTRDLGSRKSARDHGGKSSHHLGDKKSSRDLLRTKSESRDRTSVDDRRKKKKKEKKSEYRKSSRDLDKSKSERSPRSDKERSSSRSKSRRRLSGET
jgi:kinesin family protein 5